MQSMIRFPIKPKPRKLKGVLIGPGSGPAERIKYLQMLVTRLFRDERIEGREDRMDEARGYAEQLINLAIQNGDRHKPTMDMADRWLLEKDLVHKLFKVLAPRYSNYSTAYTSIYRLPANYPSLGHFKAVLELKGNPYPPVIPKQHNKDGFIVNVLIRSAKERRTKNSTEDSESSETSQAFIGLNESDESDLPQVNLKERNEDKGAENSEVVTSNEGMGKSQEINSEKS